VILRHPKPATRNPQPNFEILFYHCESSQYTSSISSFQIFSSAEIASLRKAGKILAECLAHTANAVKPGITTLELDRIAEEFILDHEGARPGFKGYRGYPGTLCTSVNDECVHGIPGHKVLDEGDIISLDCGVLLDGLNTDACITVPVGSVGDDVKKFLSVTSEALEVACALVAPGRRIGDLSHAVQKHVERNGYSCVNGLTGHGLGTHLHQYPDIPNVGKAGTGPVLPPNTIIAIEPITAMGRGAMRDNEDGWTISTADGSLSAHFEHTILVTEEGYEILA
jgi:methionyl aminopeptidase